MSTRQNADVNGNGGMVIQNGVAGVPAAADGEGAENIPLQDIAVIDGEGGENIPLQDGAVIA